MKPLQLLLTFFLCFTCSAKAQVISDSVDFNNNELSTRFIPYYSTVLLSQVSSNCITGDCLNTPNTESWGNNKALYCSRYKNLVDSTYKSSICFYWNSTLHNPNGYDRGVSINLNPKADADHYILASVGKLPGIELIGYNFSGSKNVLSLVDNHWYRLDLITHNVGGSFNDQTDVSLQVFDLGTSGQGSPIFVDSVNRSYFDYTFANDTSIRVSISGTKWGGVDRLDNFSFEAVKSSDSCNSLSIKQQAFNSNDLRLFPNPATDVLNLEYTISSSAENCTLQILSVTGQVFQSIQLNAQAHILPIDVSMISPGLYFTILKSENATLAVEKFLIEK